MAGGTLAGTGSGAAAHGDQRRDQPRQQPGVLTVHSSLSLQAGSSFVVELNGTTPGSGHDQLDVTDITAGRGR